MRWIVRSRLGRILALVLRCVKPHLTKRIDRDQYITDVGIDLIRFEALLQLLHDRILRQHIQRGQIVHVHGLWFRFAIGF
uniref:Putative secreted protein n=1 Tax=Anopheles darlingi TaxID=43151 RepID=A0A2M4D8A4_ANODA